jgi:hypothetical protein
MSPDEINARPGGPFYRCFHCRTDKGLSWYRGTSCPICDKPECIAACDQEWDRAYDAVQEDPYA